MIWHYVAFCTKLFRLLLLLFVDIVVIICCMLQAKPFINEAHVFNDAGLSFDVWPPKTGHLMSDPVPQSTATNKSSSSDDPDDVEDGLTVRDLGLDSCPADPSANSNAAGSCSAGSETKLSIANDNVRPEMEMSRGFLLAVKLWQEAVATVAAASRSAAHSHG